GRAPGRPHDREDRTRPEEGHPRAPSSWRPAARTRLRYDGRELPDRSGAARAWPRLTRDPAPRPPDDDVPGAGWEGEERARLRGGGGRQVPRLCVRGRRRGAPAARSVRAAAPGA